MYSVLLADDEINVLEMLQKHIPWHEMGIEKIFTASNGKEALDIAKENSIALLITEIRIPAVDGLTLIRILKNQNPLMHYILLSAYNELDYAHAAISLGVDNYLLKPLNMEEVEESVRRTMINIYAQRSGNFLAYSNFILQWLTGTISCDKLTERAAFHKINLCLPEYMVICFIKKASFSLSAFCEECHQVLPAENDIYYCQDEMGRHFFIIGGKKIDSEKIREILLRKIKEKNLTSKMSAHLGIIVNSAEDITRSYLSACSSADVSLFASHGKVFLQDPAHHFNHSTSFEEIELFIYNLNKDNYADKINEFSKAQLPEDNDFSFYINACLCALVTHFPSFKAKFEKDFQNMKPRLYFVLQSQSFSSALSFLFYGSYKMLNGFLNTLSPIVRLLIDYIHTDYGNGFSIRDFCNSRAINASYLGHLFKNECGIFFNDYLTRTRLIHSIELLKNPKLKVYDIAEQTGFTSTSYFVKCFRSMTGLSPAKFRVLRYNMQPHE